MEHVDHLELFALQRKARYLATATSTAQWFDSLNRIALDLYILRSNADDLRGLIAANQDSARLEQLWGGQNQDMARLSIEIARWLGNFLAAFSALADHSMVHMRAYSAALQDEYSRRLAEEILTYPSFHLLKVLRNQAQHTRFPVPIPRLTQKRGIEPRQSWCFQKDWLLDLDVDWDDSVLVLLDRATFGGPESRPNLLADTQGENDLDIDWLVADYSDRVANFTNWLIDADVELHAAQLIELQREIHGVHSSIDALRSRDSE
jgi:hypothetical protein